MSIKKNVLWCVSTFINFIMEFLSNFLEIFSILKNTKEHRLYHRDLEQFPIYIQIYLFIRRTHHTHKYIHTQKYTSPCLCSMKSFIMNYLSRYPISRNVFNIKFCFVVSTVFKAKHQLSYTLARSTRF